MGESLLQGFASALPVMIGALVPWLIHSRSYKLTQSTNKMTLRLRIFDFWQLHQDAEELLDAPVKQLKHLFYLYSGKSVDGSLVWYVLRDHPDPKALEQLILAHNEVEKGEQPGSIRHSRPRWEIEGTEVLLIIAYFVFSISWCFLLGPGINWLYPEPENMGIGGAVVLGLLAAIVTVLFFFYAKYCYWYISKARAVRLLTQTERMHAGQALKLRLSSPWLGIKGILRRIRNLAPN